MARKLISLLFLAGCIAAQSPDRCPGPQDTREALSWVAAQMDVSADVPMPRVFCKPESVLAQNYGSEADGFYLLGLYLASGMILLNEELSRFDMDAILRHELAHHLQWQHVASVPGIRSQAEADAKRIENAWRVSQGRDPRN